MSTESQEAGADTTEAGGQQNAAEGTKPDAGNTGAASEQTTGKTATELAAEAAAKAASEAEIVYEFKAPEGMTLDKAQVDEFTSIAKELKLPADKAQAVVDLAIKAEIQRAEAFEAQKAAWADEIANDKELGGDKLDQTLATAKKVYSLLPAEEAESFKAMLNASGYGNHPSMVRLLHAVGKALSEDKFVSGTSAPANASPAKSFYENSNMT